MQWLLSLYASVISQCQLKLIIINICLNKHTNMLLGQPKSPDYEPVGTLWTLHSISLAVLLNVHIKITWLGSANVLIKYFKFTGVRPTSLSPLHWASAKGHLLYMSAVTMTLHSPEWWKLYQGRFKNNNNSNPKKHYQQKHNENRAALKNTLLFIFPVRKKKQEESVEWGYVVWLSFTGAIHP